jgi:transcription elongation factor Elf1
VECPRCNSDNIKKSGFRYNKNNVTSQIYYCNNCSRKFSITINKEDDVLTADEEIILENVRLEKREQKRRDDNRIKNKSFREYARIENAVTEYSKEIVKLLQKNHLCNYTIKHEYLDSDSVGIIQISDTHFNELVNLTNNKYSFKVAAKRLKKLVIKAKEQFSLNNISTVAILLTADLLNSDRRMDELLSQATNRSKATFLSVQLLQQVILDINKDYNVVISSISGNESRVNKDIGWVDPVASENYDWVIFNFLKFIFKDSKGIIFKEPDSALEDVINIGGKNILMLHGHQKGYGVNPQNGVNKSISKYSSRGIRIDFVIFGHIHQSLISDNYARSGSLVGANAYSENSLQLTSRASQNIHIISKDGIDSYKIDLQETGNIVGYYIDEHLEAYNAKSEDKCRVGKTIFEIKI